MWSDIISAYKTPPAFKVWWGLFNNPAGQRKTCGYLVAVTLPSGKKAGQIATLRIVSARPRRDHGAGTRRYLLRISLFKSSILELIWTTYAHSDQNDIISQRSILFYPISATCSDIKIIICANHFDAYQVTSTIRGKMTITSMLQE